MSVRVKHTNFENAVLSRSLIEGCFSGVSGGSGRFEIAFEQVVLRPSMEEPDVC